MESDEFGRRSTRQKTWKFAKRHTGEAHRKRENEVSAGSPKGNRTPVSGVRGGEHGFRGVSERQEGREFPGFTGFSVCRICAFLSDLGRFST